MDTKLHLLESRHVRGSDGQTYKLMGYERLVRDESLPNAPDRWEPTGIAEYRLADGTPVEPRADGTLQIPRTGVRLQLLP